MVNALRQRRIALVHDYLADVRGGERVFHVMTQMYPDADVLAMVFAPEALGTMADQFRHRRVRTSFVQRLPRSGPWFQKYFPLYAVAARLLDLRGYDVVISSSSGWAHAVRVSPSTTHVCYCHTPFRYAWSHYVEITGRGGAWAATSPLFRLLRRLDLAASRNVDDYVANSEVTRQRIRDFYRRDATVINPPVDVERFTPSPEIGDYFLVVSSLIPYKRVDLAIEACNRLHLPLKIVGNGSEERRLRELAGPTVEFLGYRDDQELADLYSHCQAVIFPPLEDFGLVPLEAMAAGRPVIAFAGGGALETMVDGITGTLFHEQTVSSLVEAISGFTPTDFDGRSIRKQAERFSVQAFRTSLSAFVEESAHRKATATSNGAG